MENDTLELIDLEQMLHGDRECESETHDRGAVECSHDTSFRLITCAGGLCVCANMGAHVEGVIRERHGSCGYCGEHTENCWRVFPI